MVELTPSDAYKRFARRRKERAMGAEDTESLAKMLASKIGGLPSDCIAEIEAFIDYLAERARANADGRALADWAMASSADAFNRVWSNPEDDVYDAL